MSLGDSVHYLLIGNPISNTLISGMASVARSTGIISSKPSAKSLSTQAMSKALPLWKLAGTNINFVRFAGLSGMAAVILGAYGAHRKYPDDKGELRSIFEVANKYHFLHSIALATMPLVRQPVLTGSMMIIGALLFCGPCYYRAFTGEKTFNKLAPVGGFCLILAWASMIL